MDYKKITVTEKLNIREALQLLDTTGKKVLFVVRNDKLFGAVSDGDVRRWILKNGSLNESIQTIMNCNPIFITENDKAKAVKIMRAESVSAIPVVNGNREIENIYFWSDDTIRPQNELNCKVVIMAGGKGERLLPYTSIVPKPLIPIGNKPILELIIESFKKYGCKEYTLTINYKKNMIKAYFDELERDYRLNYIEENKPLGTGGSLCFLKDKMDDTFFVSNCDILLDIDFEDVYQKHKKDGNAITIVTSLKQYVLPYGVINTGIDGSVISLMEKPSSDYLVNTGVYVFEPEALKHIQDNQFMNITDLIAKCIAENNKVGTYPISEDSWMDMGQLEDLEKMKNKLQERVNE